ERGKISECARDVVDPHQGAQPPVCVHPGAYFCLGQGTLTVLLHPAHGCDHKGREHVQHLVIGDVVSTVHLVHTPDRRSSGGGFHAVHADVLQNQHGVVVSALGIGGEFPGFV